jgi:hypothetical protein
MQADAFGMFLVHYPITLWLAYSLNDFDVPVIVTAAIVFVLTVFLSWGATKGVVSAHANGRQAAVDVCQGLQAAEPPGWVDLLHSTPSARAGVSPGGLI